MQTVATLFATSNPAFFKRVQWLLRKRRDIQLHPVAVSESEALTVLRIRPFDVLLFDAEPIGAHATETIQFVATLSPRTGSLLFRSHCTDHFVVEVLRSGGAGCLPVECESSDLYRAIHAVHSGDFWASRKAVAQAFRPTWAPLPERLAAEECSYGNLSAREREIVEWMRTGLSNKEIARELGISDMTVKTHAHNIFSKLEVSGRLRLFGSGHRAVQRPSTTRDGESGAATAAPVTGPRDPRLKPAA